MNETMRISGRRFPQR